MLNYFVKSLIRFFLHILWILPVKKNKVFFSSFKGTAITCNPYYIFKELAKYEQDLNFIWCCNSDESKKVIENKKVKFVKFNSFSYLINLANCKILINNAAFPSWFPFRMKKQIVINTWHGGGAYKRVAVSEIASKEIQKREELTAKNTSYFISSSKMFTDVMIPSVLVPQEKFLNIGMPRNDIFFDKPLMEATNIKVRQSLDISEKDFVILYAPTYRESSLKHSQFNNQLDIACIRQAAQNKYGKTVKVLFRGHYFFTANNTQSFDSDLSSYPNMQELLCMADMLITDYSSSMWDFSFTDKPCLLYCPDIEEYIQKRGFYTEPDKWGFPVCKTNDDLAKNIISFDKNKYKQDIQKNHEYFGNYESGNAAQTICKIIMEKLQ